MKYHAVSSEHGLWAVRRTLEEAVAALEDVAGRSLAPTDIWTRWGGADWMAVPHPTVAGVRFLIWREPDETGYYRVRKD